MTCCELVCVWMGLRTVVSMGSQNTLQYSTFFWSNLIWIGNRTLINRLLSAQLHPLDSCISYGLKHKGAYWFLANSFDTVCVISSAFCVWGGQSKYLPASVWMAKRSHSSTLQSHKESWGKERLIKAFFLCSGILEAFVPATEEEVIFPSQEKVLCNLLCWSYFEKQWWTRWYPEVPSYLTHSLPTSRTDQSRTRTLNKN